MFVTRFFARSLLRKIGALLGLLVVLVVFEVAGVLLMLRQQRTDTLVVNIAGRQRMLSQRMTKYALLAGQGDAAARTPLKQAGALFAAALAQLQAGDPATGLPPASAAMQPALDALGGQWEPSSAALQTVAPWTRARRK